MMQTLTLKMMQTLTLKSIVVVDDEQGVLDSFDVMLGDKYALHTASNGSDAKALLSGNSPRLLFLDIKMPRPNGLEILKWIREEELPIEVVIVTASPLKSYEKIARRYGVHKYLSKPFDVDEVEDIAANVMLN
jgi:DNA-binding NtrC family response regulator